MEQNTTQLQLESPQQLADRVGIPVSNIRHLIREKMIDHLFTSPGQRNPKIPHGAWERYIAEHTVRALKQNPTDSIASGSAPAGEQ